MERNNNESRSGDRRTSDDFRGSHDRSEDRNRRHINAPRQGENNRRNGNDSSDYPDSWSTNLGYSGRFSQEDYSDRDSGQVMGYRRSDDFSQPSQTHTNRNYIGQEQDYTGSGRIFDNRRESTQNSHYSAYGDFGGYGENLNESRRYGRLGNDRGSSEGTHSGKGPKGYARNDQKIQDDVCDELERCGDVDATNIEVACKSGIVTLKGEVENRQMKRAAERRVENVYGVRDVMNQLSVQGREQRNDSNRSEKEQNKKTN